MSENAIVKVFRYDPTVDKEPRYQTYEVPAEAWQNRKVRETIRYIYENLDGSLSFRESCIAPHVCGACLMLVNKKSALACDVFAEKEMVLEPSPKFRVIKDLVVDFSKEK
jgi:succinate dehydrogenase/fumarate reductase iron-sulfur protein